MLQSSVQIGEYSLPTATNLYTVIFLKIGCIKLPSRNALAPVHCED